MVKLVYDDLNKQGKHNLIKYIIAMKLSDKVRHIITIERTPTTSDKIRTSLTKNATSGILFELKNIKQQSNVLNY